MQQFNDSWALIEIALEKIFTIVPLNCRDKLMVYSFTVDFKIILTKLL